MLNFHDCVAGWSISRVTWNQGIYKVVSVALIIAQNIGWHWKYSSSYVQYSSWFTQFLSSLKPPLWIIQVSFPQQEAKTNKLWLIYSTEDCLDHSVILFYLFFYAPPQMMMSFYAYQYAFCWRAKFLSRTIKAHCDCFSWYMLCLAAAVRDAVGAGVRGETDGDSWEERLGRTHSNAVWPGTKHTHSCIILRTDIFPALYLC